MGSCCSRRAGACSTPATTRETAADGGRRAWEREVGRRGFYPLTFPLTVGPGSISIAITLGARDEARLLAGHVIADIVGIAIVAVTVYLSYRFASRLIASLGETGTSVFLRLSAFILLCVAISILWGGIVGLIESTALAN